MGNIAKITKPAVMSMSDNPNFVQFENTNNQSTDNKINLNLQLNSVDIDESLSTITFKDKSTATFYSLKGTTAIDKIDSNTFFINKNSISITAENIKACLIKSPFIKNNFHVSIPPYMDGQELKSGTKINIQSRGIGAAYAFKSFDVDSRFITISGSLESATNDSILADSDNCEVHVDIYTGTGIFPGMEDYTKFGTHVATLSKAYFGKPLWFDVNTICANRNKYADKFLSADGWCATGTDTDFRFTAKRFNGINNETFYYSDVLYAITGYGRNLEGNDLSPYVYRAAENNVIKPLTRQLTATHIKGQTHFFNFILSDPAHTTPDEEHKIGLLYKIYSQSGNHLGSKTVCEQDKSLFHAVNTIRLDIDSIIAPYPKAGRVEVYLCRANEPISESMTFTILPQCLYKVNDFAFLNSLGGWSSANFGGMEQTDFKSDATIIHRTLTPAYNESSSMKAVYNRDVTEQFIVQTMPVTADVADSLKELATSVAVYEMSTKRYVIVEELNVKHNTKDDLFSLQMKYSYSDSYNATIK